MILRAMELSDIPGGLSLCRSAGWNQLARDWEIFLTLDSNAGKVCIEDDKVAGTVTTIRYGSNFSWIGMVLVDPAHRRKGIGLRLLQEALELLRDETCVKLDATPEGRQVYTKLGFEDEFGLSRMFANSIDVKHLLSSPGATVFTSSDLEQASKIDGDTFGANRMSLLSWMMKGAPELAYKVKKGDQLEGYCFGRYGYRYTHIGPVVAVSVEVAKDLVSSALKQCVNGPVILDIPHLNTTWRNWLESVGFSELRPFIRMRKGDNVYQGIPEKQFAILGPEFG
ncbi:GNAT family N-acetyltransferase [Chryseolinea sp. T2]|uniref:GNAT family N-acetyltransferase n=1 Tax=Chryseolinea sp. T2 TaxID=3129255 RepID=UPI0030784C46